MSQYAKEQPKDGETCLTCGHIVSEGHFFKCSDMKAVAFGSATKVDWLIACEDCYNRAGGNPLNIGWNKLCTWIGGEPCIRMEHYA